MAAGIRMRPPQRSHWKASTVNTRRSSSDQGSLLPRGGAGPTRQIRLDPRRMYQTALGPGRCRTISVRIAICPLSGDLFLNPGSERSVSFGPNE